MNGAPHALEAYVLPLSADSLEQLDALRAACAAFVAATPRLAPADLLRSAARRRRRRWRAVALAATREQLTGALAVAECRALVTAPPRAADATAAATWLLSGGGAREPAALARLQAQLAPFGAALARVHAVPGAQAPAADGVVFELCCAELWLRCGPAPARIVACGRGALSALAAAGALDAAEAARLAAAAADDGGAGLPQALATVAWRSLVLPVASVAGAALPAGSPPDADALRELLRPASRGELLRAAARWPDASCVVDFAPDASGGELEGARVIAAQHPLADPLLGVVRGLAEAYCEGLDVDLGALLAPGAGASVALPAPPLTPRRIWPAAAPATDRPHSEPPPAVSPTASEPARAPAPPPGDPVPAPPPALGGPPVSQVVEAIREQAARELGVPAQQLDADATFLEAGADSLLMVNVVRALEQRFGVAVTMRELFEEADSPAKLARLVAARAGGAAAPAVASASEQPAHAPSAAAHAPEPPPAPPRRPPRFSLYYFGNYPRETPPQERYELLFESARFADRAGFHALWLPERHFHAFGGIFPNPAVLAAALARETSAIRLHAGSVVLPLHEPIRVAEEWSVVDNLSGGRIGIGVASGWHANDFALRPQAYGRHRELMYEGLETVKALWRGEAVAARSGSGEPIAVRLHPPPLQAQPPLYTAILGRPESYHRAGAHDLGVITNLMAQDVEQLAANVAAYRAARAQAGLDPAGGAVVVLLHTYLADSEERARADAYEPFCDYMRSSLSLFGSVANSLGMNVDLASTSEQDVAYVLRRAFARYCDMRALIGTVASSAAVVERVLDAGADEIACLVDFGVPLPLVRESLPLIAALRDRFADAPPARPAAAAETEAPLSLAQERMWFAQRLYDDFRGYNEPQAIRLDGPLDVAAFEQALRNVVAAQAMLRARVAHDGERPVLRIREQVEVALPLLDASGRDERELAAAQIAEESARRFELERGPLWLARLLRFGPERHVLILSAHHVVLDLLGSRTLTRQLSRRYAVRTGAAADARDDAPAARPYGDYASRQRASLGTAPVEAALRHWQERLTPLPPPLALPSGHPDPDPTSSAGDALVHVLERETTARVEARCRAARATPFMLLAAAYAALLREAGGHERLVVGMPIADRPPDFAETVGLFSNVLPLCVDLGGAERFGDVLARTRAAVLDAHEHAAAPLEEIVRRVNPPRALGRNPLFDVAIEFGGGDSEAFALPGVAATPLAIPPSRSAFDLSLRLFPHEGTIRCHFEYATGRFDRASIARLLERFDAILRAGLDELEASVGRAPDAPSSAHARTEAALRAAPLAADAAVLPWREDDGQPALAAYVVPAAEAGALDDRDLAARLAASAGPGAPPAAWSFVTRLPRDADGRLDAHALPPPRIGTDGGDGAPDAGPRRADGGDVAAVLDALWRAELELAELDPTASFFALGGQSIQAVRLLTRIEQRFGVEYPVREFLRAPSVRDVAATLERLLAT